MNPTIGRIVRYKVAAHDIAPIMNNGVKAGDYLPAVVVRVWGTETVNLRVLCDATNDAWKTSINPGAGEGQWSWPPREPS